MSKFVWRGREVIVAYLVLVPNTGWGFLLGEGLKKHFGRIFHKAGSPQPPASWMIIDFPPKLD